MKKKITIFNFIISAILVFTVTACGQKSEENKNTSVSTNGSDMLFSTDAYEKKLLPDRSSIKECADTYEQDINEILAQDKGKFDFSNCDFADFPDVTSLKVMLEEKHGITVEEAEKTLSDWVTSIGKQTVVDMKSDVYYIPDNINETGELSLFYEDKKKLENGEGCLIDIPECYINLLGDGIYSASDGKIREYMGYEDAASYDAFGDHAEDTVESGKVSELAQKEYTLISGNLSVEQGAELVKDYFSAGTPFPCENGVTVDVPEVRIFRLGDVYGYDYTVRRKYENVPFAYMDTGHYRFYVDYLSDADSKHAYVVDDTGITAFCGYNEARKLTELISDDSMISFKQMLEFLRSGLASRLNINVERAGLVYFPVKLQGSAEKEEVIVLPCWEVFGVNEIKNEKIWIYVDVFTGEIYYYTTEINESSDEN